MEKPACPQKLSYPQQNPLTWILTGRGEKERVRSKGKTRIERDMGQDKAIHSAFTARGTVKNKCKTTDLKQMKQG